MGKISSRKLEIPREHVVQSEHNKRNGIDLTEAEEIKKRWQEHRENYIEKILMT